jgi:hypothetical protein
MLTEEKLDKLVLGFNFLRGLAKETAISSLKFTFLKNFKARM